MLVGIISDTHDDMSYIKKAVRLLNERNVSSVIHAGDYVAPFTFEILGELKAKFTGIFGNNDGDRLLLREKSGDNIHNQPLKLVIEEKKIIIVHEPDLVSAIAGSREFDIVIYGHTHTPDIRDVGNTLIINPGKVAKIHKGKSTLCLLNIKNRKAEIIEL